MLTDELVEVLLAEELCHGGDAEELLLVRVVAGGLHGGGDRVLVAVAADGAALDQFQAGVGVAGVGFFEGVGFDGGEPFLDGSGVGDDLGDLLIRQCVRGGCCRRRGQRRLGRDDLEVPCREGRALCGVAAELAPLPRPQFPLTGVGQLRGGLHHGLRPVEQLLDGGLPHADVALTRLVDDQAHPADLVDHAVGGQGAEGVQHKLRVVLGADFDAFAVLEVDEGHGAVADDEGVAGAEPVRDDVGEVDALLDGEERAGAGLLGAGEFGHDVVGVVVGVGLHVLVVPLGHWPGAGAEAGEGEEFVLGEFVRRGALFRRF